MPSSFINLTFTLSPNWVSRAAFRPSAYLLYPQPPQYCTVNSRGALIVLLVVACVASFDAKSQLVYLSIYLSSFSDLYNRTTHPTYQPTVRTVKVLVQVSTVLSNLVTVLYCTRKLRFKLFLLTPVFASRELSCFFPQPICKEKKACGVISRRRGRGALQSSTSNSSSSSGD